MWPIQSRVTLKAHTFEVVPIFWPRRHKLGDPMTGLYPWSSQGSLRKTRCAANVNIKHTLTLYYHSATTGRSSSGLPRESLSAVTMGCAVVCICSPVCVIRYTFSLHRCFWPLYVTILKLFNCKQKVLVLQMQWFRQVWVQFTHWRCFSIHCKQSQATSVFVMLINC